MLIGLQAKKRKPMSSEGRMRQIKAVRLAISGDKNPSKRAEVRKKISEAAKGRIFTEEWKRNIGLAGKGRIPWNKGINNSNKEWYKVVRKTVAYYEWRKLIFEQNNYTCQSCGIRSKKGLHVELHPHHIIAVRRNRKLLLDVKNGVTLCIECHRGFHMVNGGFQNA